MTNRCLSLLVHALFASSARGEVIRRMSPRNWAKVYLDFGRGERGWVHRGRCRSRCVGFNRQGGLSRVKHQVPHGTDLGDVVDLLDKPTRVSGLSLKPRPLCPRGQQRPIKSFFFFRASKGIFVDPRPPAHLQGPGECDFLPLRSAYTGSLSPHILSK